MPVGGNATGAIDKGTFLANFVSARALFDSGVTHRFVDTEFIVKLGLKHVLLCPHLPVPTPLDYWVDLNSTYCVYRVTLDDGS